MTLAITLLGTTGNGATVATEFTELQTALDAAVALLVDGGTVTLGTRRLRADAIGFARALTDETETLTLTA
jgi:hypothetical protein